MLADYGVGVEKQDVISRALSQGLVVCAPKSRIVMIGNEMKTAMPLTFSGEIRSIFTRE